MGFQELRRAVNVEEFDYPLLKAHLADYANPRGKIGRLIRDEKIIRVKKGLYVFGPNYRKGLICKEALANLLYGPSYISYQFALAYHNLIPERVESLTSATSGKSKRFDTPIGTFTYTHIKPSFFSIGVEHIQIDPHHFVYMATPEKALVDLMIHSRNVSGVQMSDFLYDDLRIEGVVQFSLTRLKEIAERCRHSQVTRLVKFIAEEQGHA